MENNNVNTDEKCRFCDQRRLPGKVVCRFHVQGKPKNGLRLRYILFLNELRMISQIKYMSY